MVKSMTGYGRGERSFDDGVQVTVELRSVNNRYLDCTVKGRVQKAVGRGKVDMFVTITRSGGEAMAVTVNEELAKGYIEALARLQKLGGGSAKKRWSAAELARFPDVLTVEKRAEDLDEMKARLLEVLDDIDRLVAAGHPEPGGGH